MGVESSIVLVFCIVGMLGVGGFIILCYWRRPEAKQQDLLMRYLYPAAYSLHRFLRGKLHLPYPEEKLKRLQLLYPGSARQQLEERYDCQRLMGILLLLLLTLCVVFFSVIAGEGERFLTNSFCLTRAEPGGGQQQVRLQMKGGGSKKEITVTVPERQYRPEELQAKLAEAGEYVKRNYLGGNESSEEVTKPLTLMSKIPDSMVRVHWKLDSNGYVNKDGSLNNGDLNDKAEVLLTAVLTYGQTKEEISLELILCPKSKSRQESFWEQWNHRLEKEMEETAQESILSLPQKVAGRKLSYLEVAHPVWIKLLLGGMIVCVLIPPLLDYQTEQGIKKRNEQLQREYPDLVERFILLMGAGLTVRGAWYRITEDYEQRRENKEVSYHYLYEEMLLTRYEMENGKTEMMAYTAFGRRLSLLQYMKFSTLLVQNLKKGSDDLLKRMNLEAVDAMRTRREMAKKLGEEAGTKLLLPMMMMLVIVFALIMAAAFQSI